MGLRGPCLALMTEEAPQAHALRWIVRAGGPWRMMPDDLAPFAWRVPIQKTQRCPNAGAFEAIAHDLRQILRVGEGHSAQPSAAILGSDTLQSSRKS